MVITEKRKEYSCGTVLYTLIEGKVHYLLIRPIGGGDCGFPKGHIEEGETEEQCALRETWEETSVEATLLQGFRKEISYPIGSTKVKTVVYFLASFDGQTARRNAGFEHFRYYLVPFENAMRMLTYDNAKNVLKEADAYLQNLKVS